MQARPLSKASDICWKCQWRLATRYPGTVSIASSRTGTLSSRYSHLRRRTYHSTRRKSQESTSSSTAAPINDPSSAALLSPTTRTLPIHTYLKQWQDRFGRPSEDTLASFLRHPSHGETRNNIVLSPNQTIKVDEESEWDGTEDQETDVNIDLFLRPGDVVELSRPDREPVLAVFVQQLDWQSQFFSVNGRWVHSGLGKISFAIPGYVDPALLTPILPYMPTAPGAANPKAEIQVPQAFSLPVQRILERITEDAETIYRKNAPILDGAYSELSDLVRTRMMTLTQIAKTLLDRNKSDWNPPPAVLLAVRKALKHSEFRFRPDQRSQRLTNLYFIRPKNDVDNIETVHAWIREYQDYRANLANPKNYTTPKRSRGATYVDDFINKARRLVAESRKRRDPNPGLVGPSKARTIQVEYGEDFSNTDRQLIGFLQAWVLTAQFDSADDLKAACTTLLQATQCYQNSVQNNPDRGDNTFQAIRQNTGQLFLSEIGVIMPYENRFLYDEQLMLPTIRPSRNVELLNTKVEHVREHPDLHDKMAHLRHDWGETTIYCIDDVDAQEIDDGISVSRINGKNSEYWLHVHVANPTAFFDKSHTLAGLSAHKASTVYLPERSYPMLPTWASQGYFSLGRDKPVITFSSRVDRSGSVLETKIHHGTIRNVVNLTRAEVSVALGENPKFETNKIVVGGKVLSPPTERQSPLLSPKQMQELKDLYSVTSWLWKARSANGSVEVNFERPKVRLFEDAHTPGLEQTSPSLIKSRMVMRDPIIELICADSTHSVQTKFDASKVVSTAMIAAGHSAAMWCAERGIPIMFRGTIKTPSQDILSEEPIQQRVSSYLEEHGTLPASLASQYMTSLGRAVAHSSPVPHRLLGISSYVKVTSPLRRFGDMIAHWQIEAAVLYEARTGKKFDATDLGDTPDSVLPFSLRQMQDSITMLFPREKLIRTTQRDSERFWITLALMRAFHYNEAPLPQSFKAWIRQTGDVNSRSRPKIHGYLTEYSIDVLIIPNSDLTFEQFQQGDEWEVKLHSFDLFQREIYVQPIRILSRESQGSLPR